MKYFIGSTLNRRAATNPYTAVMAFAARHPRPVGMTLAGLAGGMLLVVLIAVSSVQAFIAVSQQSMANRASLADSSGNVDAAAVFVAAPGSDAAASGPAAPSGRQPTSPVGKDQTTTVYGLRVHTSIAANLRAMLDHAKADGIVLSGWGWRDPKTQIRLRREHCGTSRYAIYEMPSSRCRPPTARPGRSQHERGLAVDFTYNGGSISSRRNAGFRWLNANAATYGFKNLASEPWHWSTTGR